MARKKQVPMQPAPLFENFQDDPRYRWYVNELYDLSWSLDMYESAYKDSPKELVSRAKSLQLKYALEEQLRTYLFDKYRVPHEQTREIISGIDAMTQNISEDTAVDPIISKEVSNG